MLTEKLTLSDSSDGTSSLSGSVVEAGNSRVQVDQQFAAGTTGQAVAGAFTAGSVRAVYLLSDQPLTLATNSATTPGNTFTLKAGIPLVWSYTAGYFSNPFTADVTGFYVTCAGSARLRIRILTS